MVFFCRFWNKIKHTSGKAYREYKLKNHLHANRKEPSVIIINHEVCSGAVDSFSVSILRQNELIWSTTSL